MRQPETAIKETEMCQMASFIVTKDCVYWSKTSDYHEDIIEEFSLSECDRKNGLGEMLLVRTEITPPDNDFRLPVNKWIFSTDQPNDVLPTWYDKEDAEKRCRLALKNWHKTKVVKKGKHTFSGHVQKIVLGGEVCLENMTGGDVQYYDRSTGTVRGMTSGEVWFNDDSSGTVSGQTGGKVWFCDTAKKL